MIHMHGGPKDEEEWESAVELHKNIYDKYFNLQKVIIEQSNKIKIQTIEQADKLQDNLGMKFKK